MKENLLYSESIAHARPSWRRRLMLVLMVALPLFLQAQTITFSKNKVSIGTAIENIRRQTNYSIDFASDLIDLNRQINVRKEGTELREVLDKMTTPELAYAFNGRHIIVTRKKANQQPAPTHQPRKKSAAGHVLKGTVTDEATGEPLIGATVRMGSDGMGVTTGIDGDFELPSISAGDELQVSYIGYKTRKIQAGDVAVMNIKLQAADDQIGEVVVVGAGTQRKISVTGAITTIKGSSLYAPSSSLTNNLAGKMAGIIAKASSGEPGAKSQFYIRGISTFGGRTEPLILLDGIEISSDDLNRLPSETIESFTILKDASATAIYGARGANGVMLVTTKTGDKNTKTVINVTAEASYNKPVHRIKYVDGATYMKLYNEALLTRHPTATPKYSDEAIEYTKSGINPYVYPDVNWYDLLFRKGTSNQRANLNVSGGGSRVTYYMSLQANHDSGLMDTRHNPYFDNNYNHWEYVFQNNIMYDLTATTRLGLRMNAQIGNEKGPDASSSSLLWDTWQNDPVTFPATYPAEANDTHVRFGNAIMSDSRLYTNPYARMLTSYKETNFSTINTSLNLEQNLDFITKGLNFTALVNWKQWAATFYTRGITPYYYTLTPGSWQPSDPSVMSSELLRTGTDYISQSDITRFSDNTFYLDGRINYQRRFGKHTVGGLLMYMMREFRNNVLPHRNQGLSGRFTYDYDNRYLAELNFGYNGTERLAKGERFELFPAMSLGWVISGEKFWKPVAKYVDFFKIRASYGLVGNDETGEEAGAQHFLYINQVNIGNSFAYTTGPYFQSPNNVTKRGAGFNGYAVANAHWERAREFDVGFDARILNQIDITFDYFNNKRDRILMKRASWPYILGYHNATPWSNVGKVDNKGFEASLTWRRNWNKDFSMELRGNVTYNLNKYTYVDEPDYPYVWQSQTGMPLSYIRGYLAEGLFSSQEEINNHADQSGLGSTPMVGDIKYRDVNGDGKITSLDEVMISDYGSMPRLQYGFGASFNWKHFDFSVFFNGSAKTRVAIQGMQPFHSNTSGNRTVMQWIADDHWSESNPNPKAAYPRLGLAAADDANNVPTSSYWVRDFSFMRWKTLEMGYSFKQCRVYFSGDNLAVFSPFKLWDPEIWWSSYPLQRTFNIGIQVKI